MVWYEDCFFPIFWPISAGVIFLLFVQAPVWADEAAGSGPKRYDIIFPVKLFCSQKQPVTVPFQGRIENIHVNSGQKVKEGDLLARYTLSLEARMRFRESLGGPGVKDLEIELAQVSSDLADLDALREQSRGTGETNADDVSGILSRIEARKIERDAILARLELGKALQQDERKLLAEKLGGSLNSDRIPDKAVLKSPLEGYVVWINPDLKKGSKVLKGTVAFQVGVMNPLMVRAEIFENEALKIAPGDRGKMIVESMREREFDVEVAYISWVPRSSGILQPSYYTVLMTVPNPDLQLREGLMGSVRFSGSK